VTHFTENSEFPAKAGIHSSMHDVNAGEKAAQDRPSRRLLGRISTATLERWDHIATIFGVPLVLLTLALGYFQIRDANRTAQMANFIALSTGSSTHRIPRS
jgi:hypothetical protein